MKFRHFLSFALALLIATTGAVLAQTSPFARTTIVSPGATAQASGTNLLTALSNVTGSSTAPWLLKLEPGVYDLGSSRLQMKSWVDIEGSSIGTTFIQGNGPSGNSDAVVKGANYSEMRLLTIRCVGTTGCRAMVNSTGATNLRNVYISADLTSGAITGIRNEGQSPTLNDVEILIQHGTGDLRGIANVSVSGVDARPKIKRLRIDVKFAASTAIAAGIWSEGKSAIWKMEDSTIIVTAGGLEAAAIYTANPVAVTSGRTWQPLINVDLQASGATTNYGIKDSYFDFEIYRSRIRAYGTNSTGITTANSYVNITNSEITGGTTIVADTANIAISRLEGGDMVVTTENCGLVVDENYAHFNNQCP